MSSNRLRLKTTKRSTCVYGLGCDRHVERWTKRRQQHNFMTFPPRHQCSSRRDRGPLVNLHVLRQLQLYPCIGPSKHRICQVQPVLQTVLPELRLTRQVLLRIHFVHDYLPCRGQNQIQDHFVWMSRNNRIGLQVGINQGNAVYSISGSARSTFVTSCSTGTSLSYAPLL